MKKLAEEIIQGRRLNRQDDLTVFLHADLESLCQGANRIREMLQGSRVDMCSIVNGRSGRCSENCKFCAQSAHYNADCQVHGFLELSELLEDCGNMARQGVDRYSIVTSGRVMEGEDLEKSIAAYQAMHEKYPDMVLCASHGLMSTEDMKRLHDAGVFMYHTNVRHQNGIFLRSVRLIHIRTSWIRYRGQEMPGWKYVLGGFLVWGKHGRIGWIWHCCCQSWKFIPYQ